MQIPARSFHHRIPVLLTAAAFALAGASGLYATNGMNMEGYGPIATAMGGASFGYDNGTAAIINNPATLGILPENGGYERGRLDLALGVLGPSITAISPDGAPAKSTATSFFMPAMGYTQRSGNLVYGLGIFGQGGMGCEYEPDTWRGLGFNLRNRTEVSVGRVIAPLVWKVDDKLTIAATADFVWAGMDLKMAMGGSQFFDLVDPTQQHFGRASGTIVQSFGQIMQMLPEGTSVDYAYFDFSNGSDFTGAAGGYGYAAKIGVHYQASKQLAFGATYHSRTALADLKASGYNLAFQLNVPGMGAMPQTLTGDFRVHDFEWPAMFGAGLSWQPDNRWQFVADIRQVQWASVMKQFHLSFVANNDTANGSFAGQNLDAALYQSWDNQTVVMLGAAYKVDDKLTLRAGLNYGNNPVPDQYLNCLFPAIVEKHVSAGFGYQWSERSSIDFSLVHGFQEKRTSGYGVTVKHSQLNAQMLYSLRF